MSNKPLSFNSFDYAYIEVSATNKNIYQQTNNIQHKPKKKKRFNRLGVFRLSQNIKIFIIFIYIHE